MKYIQYREGYKYQIYGSYAIQSPIKPPHDISERFYSIDQQGLIYVRDGYAFDGPSGPAADPLCAMRAALYHDIICQAIGEGNLNPQWRKIGDQWFHSLLIEDGMNRFRAKYWYWGVRIGARHNKDKPATEYHPVIAAPKRWADEMNTSDDAYDQPHKGDDKVDMGDHPPTNMKSGTE